MLFSELYSAYYNAVAEVLRIAIGRPAGEKEMRAAVETHAFGESALNIIPALKEEKWQLLREDGTAVIENEPTFPLTTLQKQWLNAVALDPRVRLFGEADFFFPDVEPLFTPEDFLVFDKYSDGDDYEDPAYIANFRLIFDAVKNRYPVEIEAYGKNGKLLRRTLWPEYLEYSEKDDKFRVIGKGNRSGCTTVNLGRIVHAARTEQPRPKAERYRETDAQQTVVMRITDERNALERVLLHFAHFKKQAEKSEDGTYTITVYYDPKDVTEIVIRILSFGPMVQVIAPGHFVGLIKRRLMAQKSCGQ